MYSLRLLSFLRPYWRRVLVATICVVASGASILAVPQLIRWGIDYGLNIQQVDGKPVATGEESLLVIAALYSASRRQACSDGRREPPCYRGARRARLRDFARRLCLRADVFGR